MHDNTGIPCPIEVHFLQKWNPAFECVCAILMARLMDLTVLFPPLPVSPFTINTCV